MKANMRLVAVVSALCTGVCYANPIAVGPSLPALSITQALLIDFGADFAALFIGYLAIRKLQLIATWKFLPYFTMVYIAGLAFDLISLAPLYFLSLIGMDFLDGWMYFLTAAFFLYLYNSFLSKRFFKLETIQAAVIGIAAGVLTNPVLGWIFFGRH